MAVCGLAQVRGARRREVNAMGDEVRKIAVGSCTLEGTADSLSFSVPKETANSIREEFARGDDTEGGSSALARIEHTLARSSATLFESGAKVPIAAPVKETASRRRNTHG